MRKNIVVPIIFVAFLVLGLTQVVHATAPTHTMASGWYWFQLTQGRLTFSDTILFGDASGLWSWANGITFRNLAMGSGSAPNPWFIDVTGNGNHSVTKLFQSLSGSRTEFTSTVAASGGAGTVTTIYTGSFGSPLSVTVSAPSTCTYSYSSSRLVVTIRHSLISPITVLTIVWGPSVTPPSVPIGGSYTGGMDLFWQYLLAGDFIGFFISIFNSQMEGMFLGFLLFIFAVPLYIRTGSLTYILVLWVLCGGLFSYFLPVIGDQVVGVLLPLALGGLVFLLVTRFRSS